MSTPITFNNPPGQYFVAPLSTTGSGGLIITVAITAECAAWSSTNTPTVSWVLSPTTGCALNYASTSVVDVGGVYQTSANSVSMGTSTALVGSVISLTLTDNSTAQNTGTAQFQILPASTATAKNTFLCTSGTSGTIYVANPSGVTTLSLVPTVVSTSTFNLNGTVYAAALPGTTPVTFINCAFVNLSQLSDG